MSSLATDLAVYAEHSSLTRLIIGGQEQGRDESRYEAGGNTGAALLDNNEAIYLSRWRNGRKLLLNAFV